MGGHEKLEQGADCLISERISMLRVACWNRIVENDDRRILDSTPREEGRQPWAWLIRHPIATFLVLAYATTTALVSSPGR
jgi:hypothetical protein